MKKQIKKKKKKAPRKKTQTVSSPNNVLNSDAGVVSADLKTKPKASQPPVKRVVEKKDKQEQSVLKYFHMASQFLRECKMELKKVKWPTRKELIASTAVVIVLVLLVSLFLGLIDAGLLRIVNSVVG